MLIKTVTTLVSTDSVGRPVDSIPVRTAVVGETDAAGYPVTPVSVTEDAHGVPVRFVVGKAAQNSAGQWVDTIPVTGGGGDVVAGPYPPPAGYAWDTVVTSSGDPVVISTGDQVVTLKRAA